MEEQQVYTPVTVHSVDGWSSHFKSYIFKYLLTNMAK